MNATRTLDITHTVHRSVLGDITIVGHDDIVTGLYFPGHWYRPSSSTFGTATANGFADARRQLDEYLRGDRTEFDIAIDLHGSDLQRDVWDLIGDIPYGATTTYGRLAVELGNSATAQEVGAAVGRNPVCILIPCHRVIGSTGKLTGYAGGLRRKQFLLDLERRDGHQESLFGWPDGTTP